MKIKRNIVCSLLAVLLTCAIAVTPAYAATTAIYSVGNPLSIAVDSSGNIYIVNGGNSIRKINSSGTVIATMSPAIDVRLYGVTVDGSGNIYVTDDQYKRVIQMDSKGNPVKFIGMGLTDPHGLAVDGNGNIYVADASARKIVKRDTNGNVTKLGTLSQPYDVAVKNNERIYVADIRSNTIKELSSADGGLAAQFSGFSHPSGVAVDSSGNIYVADTGNNAVKKIDTSRNVTVLDAGVNTPYAVAVDSSGGNIYVADTGNGVIKKITQQTNPTLSVSSSQDSVPCGTSVTLTASLPQNATGTVTFVGGGITLGTATVSNGLASCQTSNSIAAGKYYVRAIYSGDNLYNSYTSEGYAKLFITTELELVTVTGMAIKGETLTANVFPIDATINFVWQSSNSKDGPYYAIGGGIARSTGKTYIPVSGDMGKYLRVVTTGSGYYKGSVTSEVVGPIMYAKEAPEITSTNGTTFAIDNNGMFTVMATGSPKPTLSIEGATLPDGVTFTDNLDGTATLTGIPNAGTTGTYPFTITASNTVGTDAAQVFTLTVIDSTETTFAAVTNVTLESSTMNLTTGTSEELTAIITPDNATNKKVTWSSDNEEVAIVDSDGEVTAVAEGTATITVNTEDGSKTDTCTVTVTSDTVAVTDVTLDNSTLSLMAGTSGELKATVNPTGATNKDATWSSDNESTATVDNTGKVKAKSVGTATITVTTEDGSKTANCTVIVTKTIVAVTDVTLDSSTMSLTAGTSGELKATVNPTDATNKNVTWSSDDEDVATVDSTGKVTAIAEGAATITVSTLHGSKTANCTVTVSTAAPVKTHTVIFKNWDETIITTVTVNDGSGTVAPSNPIRDGYTFTGWDVTFNNVTNDLIVTAQFSSNASGSSGGSSKGSSSSTNTAKGYQAVISGTGTEKTTQSVHVNTNTGSAAVDLSTHQGKVFIEGGTSVISVPSISGVSNYSIEIPASSLSGSEQDGSLTFSTESGSLTIPDNMLTGISGNKAGITIGEGNKSNLTDEVKAAIGDRPLVQLTLTVDGDQINWNNPEAPVTVSIPYAPTAEELANPESIIVWYIDGSGNAVSIPNGHYDSSAGTVTFNTTHFSDYAVSYNKVTFSDIYDSSAGTVTFNTTHFSDYAVSYNKVTFSDIAENAWYNEAVSYIAARGITTGTNDGSYNPNGKLTRGQFLVMMMRAYEMSADENQTDNFADAGDTYYTEYLSVAKELGITDGVGNNMFAPDKQITRQEMFTLLYNTLKTTGELPAVTSGKSLAGFSDQEQIATWAKDAMSLFTESETISGSGEKLYPTGTTTRAEMAQVLYSLLSK